MATQNELKRTFQDPQNERRVTPSPRPATTYTSTQLWCMKDAPFNQIRCRPVDFLFHLLKLS